MKDGLLIALVLLPVSSFASTKTCSGTLRLATPDGAHLIDQKVELDVTQESSSSWKGTFTLQDFNGPYGLNNATLDSVMGAYKFSAARTNDDGVATMRQFIGEAIETGSTIRLSGTETIAEGGYTVTQWSFTGILSCVTSN